MAKKVREFRSLIYKYYDSESEFADTIKWPRQRLNKLTNGTKIPSIDELETLSSPLHISIEGLAQIFLTHKSSYERQNPMQ